MAYQSFHQGEVTSSEILTQLNTFTNDGGNVFERAMVVSNLRTFFQNVTKEACKTQEDKLKIEILHCRKDGDEYVGFSKNDTLVQCSKDPAAVGIAIIHRHVKNNKPSCGMNFIVSPDLAKKIFGDEDLTFVVSTICDGTLANGAKSDTPEEEKKKSENKPSDPKDVSKDSGEEQPDPENTQEKQIQESKPEEPEMSDLQIPNTPPAMLQTPKAGMVPMAPVRQGKHGNKK